MTIGLSAQSLLSGTVVEADGEPAIGATVKVQGTTTAAVTDVNGRFSIAVA